MNVRARLLAVTCGTLSVAAVACGSSGGVTAIATVTATVTEVIATPTPAPTVTSTPSPVVAGTVGAFFSGYEHTCGTGANGALECWGRNGDGEIGDGTTDGRVLPVPVLGLTSALVAGFGGEHHSCGLTAGGAIYCWGGDGNGQLGDNDNENRDAPEPVVGMSSGVLALGVGYDTTCSVDAGGNVWCWGEGANGLLGNGATSDSAVPVEVMGLGTAASAVAGGYSHACALIAVTGSVACWGDNGHGEIGIGSTGNNQLTAVETTPPLMATDLAAGYEETCVVTSGGGVLCWGGNGNGQIGDGTNDDRNVPTAVSGLSSGVAMVRVGENFACALTVGGAVECWGANGHGELGNAGNDDSNVPLAVSGLSAGVVRLTLGGSHACAEMATGAVVCWGENGEGELGNGTTNDSNAPGSVTLP